MTTLSEVSPIIACSFLLVSVALLIFGKPRSKDSAIAERSERFTVHSAVWEPVDPSKGGPIDITSAVLGLKKTGNLEMPVTYQAFPKNSHAYSAYWNSGKRLVIEWSAHHARTELPERPNLSICLPSSDHILLAYADRIAECERQLESAQKVKEQMEERALAQSGTIDKLSSDYRKDTENLNYRLGKVCGELTECQMKHGLAETNVRRLAAEQVEDREAIRVYRESLQAMKDKQQAAMAAVPDQVVAGKMELLKDISLSLEGTLRGILTDNFNEMDLSKPLTRALVALDGTEVKMIPWQRLRLMHFRERYAEYGYYCKMCGLPELPPIPNDLSFDDVIFEMGKQRAIIIQRIAGLNPPANN